MNIPDNNYKDDPVIVFSKAIYTLYTNYSELFSSSNDFEPFIYEGSKSRKTLICFKNIENSVEFVQQNIDKVTSSNSFNEIFIKSKDIEEILFQIKDILIKQEIQIFNKNRKDYKINGRLYFALDVEKLEEFVGQCE